MWTLLPKYSQLAKLSYTVQQDIKNRNSENRKIESRRIENKGIGTKTHCSCPKVADAMANVAAISKQLNWNRIILLKMSFCT